ncbi:hypothetical protein HHK36_000553 [Tetracentron sinense]|uniref:Protein root UVB sensitive/RUS domain-containing protein n=1 Tax=Tetracentron sinense TaxID=13715 RepID=A0A834ZRS3_TETSI|nr:hypothetical protein HHK36_000553 [Tetracentron sinense]
MTCRPISSATLAPPPPPPPPQRPLVLVSLDVPFKPYSLFVKAFPSSTASYGGISLAFHQTPLTFPSFHSLLLPLLEQGGGNDSNGGGNNNNNNNNNGWNPFDFEGWWRDGSPFSPLLFFFSRLLGGNNNDATSTHKNDVFLFLLTILGFFSYSQLGSALARTSPLRDEDEDEDEEGLVWEVRGGKWTRLVPDPDPSNDAFVVAGTSTSTSASDRKSLSLRPNLWVHCRDLFLRLMLPEGYPHSVTSDYLEYSLWRGVQGVASQISGVLATQALLYAIGLGKGAIPAAAAVNWVLKDGIGYLSKILLSKYGRHFDVHPKGWRLFADLLENAAYGMELLTPAFPHLFVLIGAAAGAGRSAAALIQAATRSCFYAGFAAQRNFAEVIAKGEAQGMVSKSIGILLGIALANCIGSSTPLAIASFSVVTWVHMFCNLKSYQSIQLRTLNPYRASNYFLLFSLPIVSWIYNSCA